MIKVSFAGQNNSTAVVSCSQDKFEEEVSKFNRAGFKLQKVEQGHKGFSIPKPGEMNVNLNFVSSDGNVTANVTCKLSERQRMIEKYLRGGFRLV